MKCFLHSLTPTSITPSSAINNGFWEFMTSNTMAVAEDRNRMTMKVQT
jgi:hypothetical protein